MNSLRILFDVITTLCGDGAEVNKAERRSEIFLRNEQLRGLEVGLGQTTQLKTQRIHLLRPRNIGMMRVPKLADRIDIRVTETANLDHEIVQKNASRYWPQFGQAIKTLLHCSWL